MRACYRHEDATCIHLLLLKSCRYHSCIIVAPTDTAGRCGVRHLCPPSSPPVPASRFFRTTDKSHLISANKGPSPYRLHQPQPYWAVHLAPRHRHQRPGLASPPPWPGRALVRGRHPPWLEIVRPVLALLAENALKACPHDASAVFSTRASASSRLRRAARQYRRALEGESRF